MNNTIMVKLYGVDNGVYQNLPKHKPIQHTFIETNQTFFDQQVKEIKQNQYKKVYLGNCSFRQDQFNDMVYACTGESFIPVLPLTQSYLQSQVDCDVEIDPILMADIFADLFPGQSFSKLAAEIYAGKTNLKHARWVIDWSKISIVYMFAHRTATLNQTNENIIIDFYGWNKDILNDIYHFYQKYPQLLPKNVTLRLNLYNGKAAALFESPIKGIADEIDMNYAWSIRYFALKYAFSNPEKKKNDTLINNASDLQKAHQRGYEDVHMAVANSMRCTNKPFNIDEFLKFRKEEITKIPLKDIKYQLLNYTTACELCREGIIPYDFILNDKHDISNEEDEISLMMKMLKSIAQEKLWEEEGVATNGQNKTPQGIKKIRRCAETSLTDFIRIAEERLQEPNWRSNKTTLFYKLIASLKKPMSNMERFSLISAFCKENEISVWLQQDDINIITSMLITLAKDKSWDHEGIGLFTFKAPKGIEKMRKANNPNLNDLIRIARDRLAYTNHSKKTKAFYELIVSLSKFMLHTERFLSIRRFANQYGMAACLDSDSNAIKKSISM